MDQQTIAWWSLVAAMCVGAAVYVLRWAKPEYKRERAVKLLAAAYADESRAEIYSEKLAELRREHGIDRPVCRPDALLEAEEAAR